MASDNLIVLSDIKFNYNCRRPLFCGLNFSLSKGEHIGITGPNGCGKTTLFYIIMGFVKPLSGEVEILGRVRKAEKDFAEVRQRIGFLFQNSDDQLFCPSVKEEVAFGPLNYRLPKEEVEKRIRESLLRVGLEGFEDLPPYTLSEGEKKRLAIATVLALKPEIMLLDEPTNGIDPEGIKRIEQILKESKLSYVIISQDLEFLKKTTDKIYIMKEGDIHTIG